MDQVVFEKLCRIAHQAAGINLREGKQALLAARLPKRLRALGLRDARAYLQYLQADTTGEELARFLDAISTNTTSFMRERDHFELLAQLATQQFQSARSPPQLWCAAAASGEEAYSMAFTLLEAFRGKKRGFRILATDISKEALEAAVLGRYTAADVEPLSSSLRNRYLQRCGARDAATYEVRIEVKQRIVFRRLNLARTPFPMRGPLEAVFCRNVMIYFDHGTRQALIAEIERLLLPGGLLFTGHSETLAGIRTALRPLRPSVYRKPAAPGQRVVLS